MFFPPYLRIFKTSILNQFTIVNKYGYENFSKIDLRAHNPQVADIISFLLVAEEGLEDMQKLPLFEDGA